ncbi:MAG: carboxypeptidase regulatory-like domain-containing protein [Acidobacteria bacterium]|nr:carboxypeptidase regulatory-like domain-containing protein [Acidobacteriota bacterium]
MKNALFASILMLAGALSPVWAQAGAVTLKGQITDPSGASVPAALVQLRGPGGEQRAYTDESGAYAFTTLRPGKYNIRVIAKGFTVSQFKDRNITAVDTLDVQLTIEAESQVINVEAEAAKVSLDPDSTTSALVMGEKELAALSDDPDELAQQLQAMAGPAAGPNGGQIFIDGFSGGSMPPKSSIREVRINSNPYSTEYDRPGFGRIEILTRPGTDKIRGQAFAQYNNQNFNSRSPLLDQPTLPPYSQKFFGFNLTGPIKKGKASFGFDLERRNIDENAFILATTLDSNYQPVTVNTAVVTPQMRTNLTPRLDLALNSKNTLVARYQHGWSSNENEGVGGYALPSKAYSQTNSDHAIQVTETAVLSARAINEARFQWRRSSGWSTGTTTDPALSVQGAFEGGGAQVGNSGSLNNSLELSNITTLTRNTHTWKWGGRLRNSWDDDTSVNNFGGTYTFFGGMGPALDANNQPIPGQAMQLTALERYQRTLYLQSLGYGADLIRLLGGGASQFSMGAGTPTTGVSQFDAGFFFNDDWRLRRNLTLSYGVRYETQTNIGDYANIAPRAGLAWGLGKGNNIKTVLRVGAGIFYDRVNQSYTLQEMRFNGTTQQAYLIRNPDFFPVIPSPDTLEQYRQPQQLRMMYDSIKAPRSYQASVGIERQVNNYVRVSAQYVASVGDHVLRTRNINAPVDGSYPYGDSQYRLLTESTGRSATQMFMVSPNVNYKKLFLFGFYSLGHGRTNAEGTPADPYNLRAEWGPSSFGDIRHRAVIGTSLPMPWKISVSPFMMVQSGSPYNITTGRDTNLDGYTAERPALMAGLDSTSCAGGNMVWTPGFGCFNTIPASGTSIERNYGRGPSTLTLNLRMARTWSFGNQGESGTMEGDRPPAGGPGGGPGGAGGGGGGMRGGGGPGGPGMMGGGPGGPGGMRGGMGGSSSGRKYNLTLSASAHNILNHANYAAPSGDLSSPYFGEYRSLAGMGPMGGASTYNRKIDFQMRFSF